MKTVRVKNSVVQEVIPDYAIPVEKWYGQEFAAQCVDAPDEVEQGWIYNQETGAFSEPDPEPEPPAMTTEEAVLDMLAELDYRMGLLELGLTTNEGGDAV